MATLSPETAPATFFDRLDVRRALGMTSVDDLWDWAVGGGSAGGLPVGDKVVYRGQSHADFGLTSSLYRLCRKALPSGVAEKRLAEVEAKVLAAMRSEGLGRRMSDGQLLSVLQHHGVPTRLIDFSRGPLEALYFAVEGRDGIDGRMFVVRVDGRPTSVATEMPFESTHGDPALPWASYARGNTRAQDPWTQTVALVDPKDLDPRMVAQRGVFLVGGLNRRSAGRSMRYAAAPGGRAGRELAPTLYADVTSLGVNFTTRISRRPHGSWPASGWTIKIDHAWKPELRSRLASLGDSISRDTMYPPVDEVARLANYAVLEDLAQGSRL
ncbi:FRG domain-containing protein [Cellulomonas sp. APG4]|uniref:FRG domain-containing protein n=1 Tax=Cellulomonas sp. APG4 TaxID=1538656 RepID=UPI001ED8CF88|nr:FRG domain-containing protein [Cellulomonas sp. APG4]NCT91938.1 FRG domain-containing protein [Cellulomonas sp. APG4]